MTDMDDAAAETGGKGKDSGPALTRKLLAERVAAVTGGKAKDVRTIVEATLTVMGEALRNGEALRLPPFGSAKVKKAGDDAAGTTLRATIKGAKPVSEDKQKAKAARAEKPARAEKAAKPAKAAAKTGKAAKPAGAARARKAKQPLEAPAEAE